MMGTPPAIVNATLVAALDPPPPVAVKLAVNKPFVVGVPEMAPVEALIARPAGNPVALQDVAGRSTASVSAIVPEKISPTLQVNVWPAVIIGAPTAIEIVTAVAAPVPPGPVAVSVIVVLPLSCGVPVITPVVVSSVAQLGKPVAAQFVAGRLALSVSAGVTLNADPTLPVNVWPAGMLGTPAPTASTTPVQPELPPGPIAWIAKGKSLSCVGVPVISPE